MTASPATIPDMSREHAIYKPQAHSALKSTTSTWPSVFSPAAISGTTPGGILLEGQYQGRSRHTITDSAGTKHRFAVLRVIPDRAYTRRYLPSGDEIEFSTGQTKLYRTGHLRTSHQTKETEASGELPLDQARASLASSLPGCGAPANCVELWMPEDSFVGVEIEDGQWVRIKTKGKGNMIDTIGRVDQRSVYASNDANTLGGAAAAGGSGGKSWLENIKRTDDAEPLPQDKMEGADESDWD